MDVRKDEHGGEGYVSDVRVHRYKWSFMEIKINANVGSICLRSTVTEDLIAVEAAPMRKERLEWRSEDMWMWRTRK